MINNSKYDFTDGTYSSKAFDGSKQKVYVDNEEESLFIYPIKMEENTHVIDTSIYKPLLLPQNKSSIPLPSLLFRQNSFDIDFLTILIKVRPSEEDLPTQFNTNFNGAVYFGYRSDIYKINYNPTPLNHFNRKTTHIGLSIGGFLGVGSTDMNPFVTSNQINEEYDGLVISKGIAGILGFNNFNVGITLGFDTLPDRNRRFWIYQNKPWLGLALGLNLN
ncbi:MAG: hypothetical protein M3421_08385 [Bacteroidota bacterium]|nr:hypothetical protein [Bacteroidota bacterium]